MMLDLQDTTTASAQEATLGDTVQRELCESSALLLRAAGLGVSLGEYGDLTALHVQLSAGKRLCLLPMAETIWGDRDEPDLDVWHVMALDVQGDHLQYPFGHPLAEAYDVCPSVLWAGAVGVDPAVALSLVDRCLADEELCRAFALSR
ncbi:hypothetical protein [Kineococcus sp. SYSU DK002]|uniref:hypothetical protein n=1 Tax=Kineococcus sp. SYSU DK002 TaxID=3383123 RepID=UPI003D7DC9A2